MKRGQTVPLSIAPMMDRTDRHYRYFMRLITKRTLLYTEMVTTKAILHGNRQRLLGFSAVEHPISLQVGGDSPEELALCARIAEDFGYDEVNINVGCPSNRVQSGNFGACLMTQPELVAQGVAAMRKAVSIPVTVKHRIGVDQVDRYEDMANFVDIVSQAGADRFSVHARKAWLKGLSPKQNRTVPPLRYPDVYRLKREFPHLDIEINGGIKTLKEAQEHLRSVDAVMIGRGAYDNPWLFAQADRLFFSDNHRIPTRNEVAEAMLPYIERHLAQGVRMLSITRHMLQLYSHRPGAKLWKRGIGEASARARTDVSALRTLLHNPILTMVE